jgi:hypothetical protein
MINDGILPAQRLGKGAPWIIRACDLERNDVRPEARARRLRCPLSGHGHPAGEFSSLTLPKNDVFLAVLVL